MSVTLHLLLPPMKLPRTQMSNLVAISYSHNSLKKVTFLVCAPFGVGFTSIYIRFKNLHDAMMWSCLWAQKGDGAYSNDIIQADQRSDSFSSASAQWHNLS